MKGVGKEAERRRGRKGSRKVGLPPGTLVHVGEQRVDSVRIRIVEYDADGCRERTAGSPGECLPPPEGKGVTWIEVAGLHEVGTVEELGRGYGVHPLVLEDILNTGHRPKFEDLEDYLFLVAKILRPGTGGEGIEAEQLGLVLGQGWVLSFRERAGEEFEPVRQRIRGGKGRIRKRGADYLAYALLDTVVDGCFLLLDGIEGRIEVLENELVGEPDADTLRKIHGLRREMITLRRATWPLREVVKGMVRAEAPLVQDATAPFLRDLEDHALQVADTVESCREILAGMLDTYLSTVSNRMNAVMKVLTIIATLFIPLTFIAGIYGMNFKHMPELEWRWGYAAVWAMMLAAAGCMVLFFRRKRWL